MTQERISSEEYRRRVGAPVAEKPQIRLPKLDGMNKTEASFELYLRERWKLEGTLAKVMYEPLTLRLPSGTKYTPDFMVVSGVLPPYPTLDEKLSQGIILEFWECKGPHIHSAASLRAFKEARSAFPFWNFKFAQKRQGQWTIAE